MIGYVVMTVGPLLLAAWWLARWLAWRTRHESIVRGVVDAEKPPVVVWVDQSLGHRSGRWEPTDAKVEAHAFTLIEADGTRVHVEPDERSDLLWAAQKTVPSKKYKSSRTRVTSVEPGMTVEILGALEVGVPGDGPYRDGTRAMLSPPRWGNMLFSTEPLAPHVRRIAKAYSSRVALTIGLAAVLHALLPMLWSIDLAWFGAGGVGLSGLEGVSTTARIVRYAVAGVGVVLVIAGWRDRLLPWSRQDDEIDEPATKKMH